MEQSVNSIQAYWNRALRGYETTRTRFFDAPMETGCGRLTRDRAVLLPARPVCLHRPRLLRPAPVAARRAGRPCRRTSWPTSTATMSRTSPASCRTPTVPARRAARCVEAQADCYAGLWVGNALDTGFIEDLTRQDVADASTRRRRWATTASRSGRRVGSYPKVVDARLVRATSELVRARHRGLRPAGCDTFKGQV